MCLAALASACTWPGTAGTGTLDPAPSISASGPNSATINQSIIVIQRVGPASCAAPREIVLGTEQALHWQAGRAQRGMGMQALLRIRCYQSAPAARRWPIRYHTASAAAGVYCLACEHRCAALVYASASAATQRHHSDGSTRDFMQEPGKRRGRLATRSGSLCAICRDAPRWISLRRPSTFFCP